jgi:hypothetical protein
MLSERLTRLRQGLPPLPDSQHDLGRLPTKFYLDTIRAYLYQAIRSLIPGYQKPHTITRLSYKALGLALQRVLPGSQKGP